MVQIGALVRALSSRRRIGRGAGHSLILPLHGGAGALVKRSASLRLVTIASRADAENPARGLAGWLERMQARRSAILVVPDRPSGVAIALRWGLNPERFRLADDFDPAARGNAISGSGRRRPWHSRG